MENPAVPSHYPVKSVVKFRNLVKLIDRFRDLKNPANRFRGSAMVTLRGDWASARIKRNEGGHIRQCCQCKVVEMTDGSWQLNIGALNHGVTHGLCIKCAYLIYKRIGLPTPVKYFPSECHSCKFVESCGYFTPEKCIHSSIYTGEKPIAQ